jgi:hypothetical protein
MRTIIGGAVLVTLAAAAAPLTPAAAAPADGGANGCVSNAEYARLANGQRLSYVRATAGDDAQTGWRNWSNPAGRYQERLYTMCTPTDSAHATLTTRFMHWQGAWRTYIVDTHVGPEE